MSMAQGEFTLEDFRRSLDQLERLGSMRETLAHLPAIPSLPELETHEEGVRKLQGILDSMTPDERNYPERINPSRTLRIAWGSGTKPAEVRFLLRMFNSSKPIMRKLRRRSW